MSRAEIVRDIAALASNDRDLFHALWESLSQYIDNQGLELLEDVDRDVIARTEAADVAMVAFDTVIADLA